MKEQHHKHPPLKRPVKGNYHKCEWAIYGTTCSRINELYHKLNKRLQDIRLLYVDADHSESSSIIHQQIGKKNFTLTETTAWNKYDDLFYSNQCDAVLVNGNHYPASRQIVIIDPKKKESLFRRKEQLRSIDMVIADDNTEIYDFVRERMSDATRIVKLGNIDPVADFINKEIKSNLPPLKALVLAGGKSMRMGQDKSSIVYHDKPQQLYVAEMCANLGMDSYISKQIGFSEEKIGTFKVIKDRMEGMGPFGAIMSAMMSDPDAAWCVIACDLPFLTENNIKRLLDERDASAYATAFRSTNKDFPEPLITIYEPRSYQRFLSFLSLGYACPRKVLINSDIKTITIQDDRIIENVNTPEEMTRVIKDLKASYE